MRRFSVSKKVKDVWQKYIFWMLLVLMLLGAAIGALMANSLSDTRCQALGAYVSSVFADSRGYTPSLADGIVKYGRILIVIWLCGFLQHGVFVTAAVNLVNSMAYGFTTSFLVRQFGLTGLFRSFAAYFMQSVMLLPIFVFVSLYSIRYARTHNLRPLFSEYAIVLFIGAACVTLAALIDAYVAPRLMQFFI